MPVEIIHNIIPLSLVRAAEAAWPSPDWPYWHRYQGRTADKFGSMDRFRIPAACLAALDALAIAVIPHIGESFIDYDLHAAGMHMMVPGGFLTRHIDAECHPLRRWRRTHSVVMCVNSEWTSDFGGQLVFGGERSVTPQQGQAVIFETENQWHEVTQVRRGTRKTLALFAWQSTICDGTTSATFQES